MYSVEDLLISHGYKISSNNNVPPSHSSSSQEQRPATRSSSRCEITDKRTGHGAVNGYKADCVYGGGVSQTSSRGGPSDTEIRDKNQRTEEDSANLVDGHSPRGTLTSDSGFHDAHREMYTHPRPESDVSYWRRRGQDFNVLLDYVDIREPQGQQLGGHHKAEGMQRRPESALTTEEHRRERQRRADSARAREREMALYQWKMAAERKYQSLGTEEWRPALGIGRHMSESEGERWAKEQRRPRTAEGAVPPRTKAKSQSLPRMAMPSDSIQYLSMSSSGQDPCGSFRINGHQSRVPQGRNLSEGEIRERWTDNSRSGVQSAPPSKPRFSRPLRPPSYEVHQQMRGSSEMLSGDFVPHPRDRTPLPFSRQDYFAQELGGSGMEPPGYIPPPSYRRQPVIRGGQRTYANSMGNYQYRGDPYMQGPAMAEVQEWFMRQTGVAWPDNYRDGRRSMPCRRQAYPGYGEEHIGNIQYIPFDDPRVRHISGGRMDGNSLTDADKIRNIRKDIPITSSTEKSPDDSAFLLSGKPFSSTEANSGGDQNANSPDFSTNHKYSNSNISFATKPDHKKVSENSKVITGSERSPCSHAARRQHFTFLEKYDNDDYDDDPYLSNEKTIADEHLEALLSQEKANSMPTEDLSNLYQIQCAKGIPVHESIEQRAARILGIAVPAEALVISQECCKQDKENEHRDKQSMEKAEFVMQTKTIRPKEETQHVSRECEQVIKTTAHTHELMEESDPAIGQDHDFTEAKFSKESHTTSLVLDLPEFPPNNLRLSLPVTEDEDLILSVCGGEKKVRSAADMSEGQPDKSVVYHPSSVCRNEEMSAERINPVVEDESMSCVSGFKKKIQKGRGEEEIGKEGTENRVQEDSVLEGEEDQFVVNEMRVNKRQAAFEKKIDEDIDRTRDEEEETNKEIVERTIQSPQSMGCSVPVPQSRSGTVVKREITLPDTFSLTTDSDSLEDDEIQSVS
ncbi:hypothetical protein QTP86_013714, partial [Hemibagrus guttatus]